MTIGLDEKPHGASHIGQVIEDNFPLSWEWKIDLLTEQDCVRILLASEPIGKDFTNCNIGILEENMIKRFSPLYNVLYGGGYHEDPTTTKELDEDYKNFFG